MSNDILIQQYQTSGYNLLNPYFQDKDINSMFGLVETATNKDLWKWLRKYNQYCWKKTKETHTYTYDTTTTLITDGRSVKTVTLGDGAAGDLIDTGFICGTDYSFDSSTGKFTLTDSTSLYWKWGTDSSGDNYVSFVPGNYVCVLVDDTTLYKSQYDNQIPIVPPSYIPSTTSSSFNFIVRKLSNYSVQQIVSTVATDTTIIEKEYVFSADSNAYPEDGDLDGWHYTLLGIPFENLPSRTQCQSGSYVGTGGSTTQTVSLTFEFVPKMVVVMQSPYYSSDNQWNSAFVWTGYPGATSNNYNSFSVSGKTLLWTITGANATSAAQYGCNRSGVHYYYFGIG